MQVDAGRNAGGEIQRKFKGNERKLFFVEYMFNLWNSLA